MNLLKTIDFFILLPALGLSGISLFILKGTAPQLVILQINFIILGLFLYLVISRISFRFWPRVLFPLYIASLILTLLSFFGPNIRGSSRWIEIGTLRWQPSEIIKPVIILLLSFQIIKRGGFKLTSAWKPFFLILPILILIYRQPDMGNVIVFLFIYLALEILNGINWTYLVLAGFIFLGLTPLLPFLLKSYQIHRLL